MWKGFFVQNLSQYNGNEFEICTKFSDSPWLCGHWQNLDPNAFWFVLDNSIPLRSCVRYLCGNWHVCCPVISSVRSMAGLLYRTFSPSVIPNKFWLEKPPSPSFVGWRTSIQTRIHKPWVSKFPFLPKIDLSVMSIPPFSKSTQNRLFIYLCKVKNFKFYFFAYFTIELYT